MNRRKKNALASRAQRVASLDAHGIDELYGLEPVFEPAADRSAHRALEFVAARCPYCGEQFETRVDLSAGEHEYIEDCEVCCRPVAFSIELEANGALRAVHVQRVD